MQNDLISRSALLELFDKRLDGAHIQVAIRRTGKTLWCGIHTGVNWGRNMVIEAPAVDAVSRAVLEQIRWERDCAMQQLKDHGIPFGGTAPDVVKVVRCKDCKHGVWVEDEQMFQCFCEAEYDPELSMYLGLISYEDADFFCKRGERRADDEDD